MCLFSSSHYLLLWLLEMWTFWNKKMHQDAIVIRVALAVWPCLWCTQRMSGINLHSCSVLTWKTRWSCCCHKQPMEEEDLSWICVAPGKTCWLLRKNVKAMIYKLDWSVLLESWILGSWTWQQGVVVHIMILCFTIIYDAGACKLKVNHSILPNLHVHVCHV